MSSTTTTCVPNKRVVYAVKQATAALISIANRADRASDPNTNLEDTCATDVYVARRLLAAQDNLLEAIRAAWAADHEIAEVELQMVAPVLVASVLSDLARMTVHQVVEQSRQQWQETLSLAKSVSDKGSDTRPKGGAWAFLSQLGKRAVRREQDVSY